MVGYHSLGCGFWIFECPGFGDLWKKFQVSLGPSCCHLIDEKGGISWGVLHLSFEESGKEIEVVPMG